jgi:tetratricopeptide (TPR) repeat protein
MILLAHSGDDGSSFTDFDSSQIFIAREQQIDFFEIYLNRWKKFIFDADPDYTVVTYPPSPDNKIQSLVVLLYGRGGFGKSTLLRHYRDVVLRENQNALFSKILIGSVIDWEFAVEGKRFLFNLPQGQNVDAFEYFRLLCNQFAIAFGKTPSDFKEYQSSIRDIEKARKKASGVLDSMQKDDRYAWLRGLTVEAIMAAVRSSVPGSSVILDQPSVKSAANEVAKITQEQFAQVHAKLHDKLGNTLGDYLEASLRLGLALGRDLHEFAKNYPLLIFFDTYEEVDEGDQLLRTVMGAAGLRVGWVIAGRDNLWGGSGQLERNIALEYGYKDVTLPDRRLAVDFNVGGVGAFTISDIMEYFAQVCEQVAYDPPLPEVTEEEAGRILDVTQGVPLAVKIAAGLYVVTADMKIVTEKVESKRKIVDQMVRRYLLHTRAEPSELAHLYGLALLRRADQPATIAVALGLTPEQAKTSYARELSRLHRRYSFIFTEKEHPLLHQEVRHFLRLWLLEHRTQPEIVAVNEQLLRVQRDALKKLEDRKQYTSLKERLEDEEWIRLYSDLTDQTFWLDPTEGVEYGLPLMLAASIYRRGANREIVRIGKFFEAVIPQPSRKHWAWAAQSLIFRTSRDPSREEFHGLEELVRLASERCPRFSTSLLTVDYQKELEAALWWRLGEAYQGKNDNETLKWHEKALTRLGQNSEFSEATARVAWRIASKLLDEKKYFESKTTSDRAIELCPDFSSYYNTRGIAYDKLKNYQQAIADYNRAIELDATVGVFYNNRGVVQGQLKNYQQAIVEFDHAIELDATFGKFYCNRGLAQDALGDYQQAIVEFDHAIELDATDGDFFISRGNAYYELKDYQQAIVDYNRAIELDTTSGGEYNLARGLAYTALKDYQQAIIDFNRAMKLDTDLEYDGQFRKGKALHSLERFQEAISAFHKALIAVPAHGDCLIWLARSYMAFRSKGGISRSQTEIPTMRSVDFEEVLDYFNRTIKLNPTDTNALYNRGETYNLMGYHKEALTDFDRAIALDKSNTINVNKKMKRQLKQTRTLILSYLKRYEEAIEDFEQLLKEDPDNETSLYNIAVAMTRERGIAEAQTTIDKAYTILLMIRGSERRHISLYGLGGLEALIGNIDQALDYLEAALPLEPEVLYWARSDGAWLDLQNNSRFQTLIFEGNNLENVP